MPKCPKCGYQMEHSIAINGGESEFWYNCSSPKCNTYYNSYRPQAHQEAFHLDSHLITGNFGGYGSGKTLNSRQQFYKHMLITPGGNTLIGANVSSQYEMTIKRDIEADLPLSFVKHISNQKAYIDFNNGHRVMFRPFDDVNKLRSYNITMFIILEASEVKPQAFEQLKTRLRNLAATVPKLDPITKLPEYTTARNGVKIPVLKADWRKGIAESNPDSGWIREELLLYSDRIYKHGRILDEYKILEAEQDVHISSHVTATEANEFLPVNFIQTITKNKPAWWVKRYVYGSFNYAEGLVYPNAQACIVPRREIPREWKRMIAYDYGLSDDSVFLFAAVDEANRKVVIYKEVRVNNKSVEYLAKLFLEESKDIPFGGMICPPIIDPKSAPKRDYDKKTLADHFLDYGVAFIPGAINIDARIFRLNTYIEAKYLEIMDCCEGLIKEIRKYKFRTDSSDMAGWSNKPEDKDNHGINALEWITMELPADPGKLLYGIYNKMGKDLSVDEDPEKQYHIHALSDDDEDYGSEDRTTPFGIINYSYNGR